MLETHLKKLVSLRTLSENHRTNKKALEWIRGQLKGLPLFYKSFSSNKFPSLVVTTKKTKQPKLWLYAHIDVVDGSSKVFRLRKKDGKYYGRGVFDMKFAVVCYLRLLNEMKDDLPKLNLGLMLTSDEEIGGFNGTARILEKGYRGSACFCPDGGNDWKFERAAKGMCYVLVESVGSSCHGSRPWKGDNALENLMDFLGSLRKRFPTEPCDAKDHFHNTINVGQIESGGQANQVPDFARALVDIRLVPKTSKSAFLKILNEEKKRFRDIKLTPLVFSEAYKTDVSNKYFKKFKQIAKDNYKIKCGALDAHGSSDARFFAEKNIPTLSIRPKGGGQHAEDEWISVRDLERFYKVLKEFALKAA